MNEYEQNKIIIKDKCKTVIFVIIKKRQKLKEKKISYYPLISYIMVNMSGPSEIVKKKWLKNYQSNIILLFMGEIFWFGPWRHLAFDPQTQK